MFESESGTAPGVELSTITDRMEIRKAVQAGDVEQAIEKVNDLDPEVGVAWAELLFRILRCCPTVCRACCCEGRIRHPLEGESSPSEQVPP